MAETPISPDEVTRRIDEARAKSAREAEIDNFTAGLTKNDNLLNPIYNPEAWIMRDKAASAAKRGTYPNSGCPHPVESIQQFIDEDPLRKRDGMPLNMFECNICHELLWIVDPYGDIAADGGTR